MSYIFRCIIRTKCLWKICKFDFSVETDTDKYFRKCIRNHQITFFKMLYSSPTFECGLQFTSRITVQLKFGRTTCENRSKIAKLNYCPTLLTNVIFNQLQFPFRVAEANLAQFLLPLALTLLRCFHGY